MTRKGLTYRDSGVDIDAGDDLVERIKPHVARTLRPEVIGGLGGFGGLFALPKGYTDPVLVSGTDGVGTKLKVAFATGRHDTIGIELVAMCVNDIGVEVADDLLRPTRIYVKALRAGLAACDVRGAAHITGGGLVENPPRILTDGQAMRLDPGRWPVPAVFQRIAQGAGVELGEMRRTFN